MPSAAPPMAASAPEALKQAVQGFPSGQKLIKLLKSVPLQAEQLAEAFHCVLREACRARYGVAPAEPVDQTKASVSSALSSVDSLSFLNPRGKHALHFLSDSFVVLSSKASIGVPYKAVKHLAILENVPSIKGGVLLYLHVSQRSGMLDTDKAVADIVIQTISNDEIDIKDPRGPGRLQGQAAVVLCTAFGKMGVTPTAFCSPDPGVFKSAGGAMTVEAYVKANQGWLFPLRNALLFLGKPMLFFPLGDIRSVELLRSGGASSTFDLLVHFKPGSGPAKPGSKTKPKGASGSQELCNISRSVLPAVIDWVQGCRLRLGPPADEDAGADAGHDAGMGAAAPAEDESLDEEDSDFDPDGSSEGEGHAANQPELDDDAAADQESSGDEDDDSDDSGSCELVSDDEVSAKHVRQIMEQEGGASKKKRKFQ